jgi:lipoprotein-anchoring transpeptidase ErfK/SrfK
MRQSRRSFLVSLAASALVAFAAPCQAGNGEQFSSPQTTTKTSIVIKTKEHQLYFYRNNTLSDIFPVAVGRAGRQWSGQTFVSRKVLSPKWAPPPIIRKENPDLPALIGPGPNNPLGAAVLVLGDGNYGIHGTNKNSSIGRDVSYGCIRMYNHDILRLFSMVDIGTPVSVDP